MNIEHAIAEIQPGLCEKVMENWIQRFILAGASLKDIYMMLSFIITFVL